MKRFLSMMLTISLFLGVITLSAMAETKDYSKITIRLANHDTPGSQSPEVPIEIANFQAVADRMGFTLEIEGISGDELRNKIKVDAAADNLPDLFKFWNGGVMMDYVAAGLIQPIDDYLALSTFVKEENYPESAWLNTYYEGVRYAIPYQQGIGVFLANTEIFEECGVPLPVDGWSLDEFLAACKVFREHGYQPTNVGSLGGNPSHFFYGDFVCQYADGNELTATISEHLQFDNPTFRKAAEYMEVMRVGGAFPDDVAAAGDWTPSAVMYAEGKSAMCYTFGWTFSHFDEDMVAKSEPIPLPKLPDSDRDPKHFIQGTVNDNYMISKKAWADPLKRDCIVALLDQFFGVIEPEVARIGARVPVDRSVLAQVDYTLDKTMMGKVMAYRIANNVEGSPMIWQSCPDTKTQFDYQAYLDELWAGSISPDTFMKKTQASFDEYRDDQ
ncbi:MAG: ABC transporter substrate-binding protein [Christensenellales bacterium]|jgi:raffinose/stachyose/melibiose transport system substrate-binding protein